MPTEWERLIANEARSPEEARFYSKILGWCTLLFYATALATFVICYWHYETGFWRSIGAAFISAGLVYVALGKGGIIVMWHRAKD
jgi:hypothetical protein